MHYTMVDVIVQGRVLAWGNSYGIRIRKQDLERAGLKPGEQAVVRIEAKRDRIDVSQAPFFRGGRSDVSKRHDEYLGQARSRRLQKGKGS